MGSELATVPRARAFVVTFCLPLVLGACQGAGQRAPWSGGHQERFGERAVAADTATRFHAWRSGEMEGVCLSAAATDRLADEGLRDVLTLPEAALFEPGSARLAGGAEAHLERLLERASAYTGLARVAIGVTRAGGGGGASPDDAATLADERERVLRERFVERFANAVPVSALASDERLLRAADASAAPGVARIEIRLSAEGVRKDNRDPTVCRPSGRVPHALSLAPPPPLAAARPVSGPSDFRGALPVSAGDRLRIHVPGDGDFDGVYTVGAEGGIDLPYLDDVPVQGLAVPEIETLLERRLVERRLLRAGLATISVAVREWAAADVYVRGAVFAPGRRVVNRRDIERETPDAVPRSGDFTRERLLSRALAAAGGVRPDADLGNVSVHRGGSLIRVDLGGVVDGRSAEDLPLIAGDEIVVPSLGRFDAELVRPSQITPPGMRVFLSNMSVSSGRNVVSSVGSDADELPYGTRMLHALVSANCAGGVQRTNGTRRAVLISTNPMNGRVEVIERDIEDLLREPDREDVNPYVMPNDALLCYDSGVTGVREIARTASDLLAPFVSLRILFGG